MGRSLFGPLLFSAQSFSAHPFRPTFYYINYMYLYYMITGMLTILFYYTSVFFYTCTYNNCVVGKIFLKIDLTPVS